MTTLGLLTVWAMLTPGVGTVSTPRATTTAEPAKAPRAITTVIPRSATPSPRSAAEPPLPIVTTSDVDELRNRQLLFPVPAVRPGDVADSFGDVRSGGAHEALDIAAPRGALVLAVDDGVVEKLFESVPGGHTVYVFDRLRRFAYYYAHLESYAAHLREHDTVRRGDLIGYVGTSGNAAVDNPHLHFAIFKLEDTPRWWRGTPINPHPLWMPERCANSIGSRTP